MIAFGILALVVLCILMTPGAPKWKVYGTKTCGWTVKQLDYMKKNGKAYTFIDCANGGKCDGMNGFPTLVDPNGVKIVGYTEI